MACFYFFRALVRKFNPPFAGSRSACTASFKCSVSKLVILTAFFRIT